jgi:PP-loop superfamily ATP-utilizing enzyme
VSSDPTRTFSPQCYRGPNVIDKLLMELRQRSEELGKILKNVEDMKLTSEQEHQFQKAKRCYLCNKLLGADRVCSAINLL